jgi:glutamine amidotransferase
MCRILALQADRPLDPQPWFAPFAERCRESKEYQGHGWGVAWRVEHGWARYRSLRPIWEDRLPDDCRSHLVLVHARSAFRDEGIEIENNMPFVSGPLAFTFNGELRGVRLSAPGATGAARLSWLLERFRASADGDGLSALRRLDGVVTARSEYVRALNVVATDGVGVWVNVRYSEDPDYFTLHRADATTPTGGIVHAVSSERFDVSGLTLSWAPIANGTTCTLGEAIAC